MNCRQSILIAYAIIVHDHHIPFYYLMITSQKYDDTPDFWIQKKHSQNFTSQVSHCPFFTAKQLASALGLNMIELSLSLTPCLEKNA